MDIDVIVERKSFDVELEIGNPVVEVKAPDHYNGPFDIFPSDEDQIIPVKEKTPVEDICVKGITGEKTITENGTYNVLTDKAVIVNNPAQWTTEGFISGTEPAGDIYLNNLNTRKNALFSYCTEITKVVAIRTRFRSEIFNGCTKLKEVFFQSQRGGGATFEGGFAGCTALAKAVFYSAGDHAFNRIFFNCHNLEKVDLDVTNSTLDVSVFENCYKLTTLVLRRTDSVVPTTNKSSMTANTPFRGYQGQSGTIYVPQDLIETYKITGVWKTLYDGGYTTFFPIEGSPYEHYYVDGTPIETT